MKQLTIVGIAGLPRSGKDTLAELFIKQGFFGVSLGDIMRDEARQRHADKPDPISIANMTETSNHLRSLHGADVALQIALSRYQEALRGTSYKGLVLYSIRAPVEADFIRKHKGRLIWVEAADDVRYARAVEFSRDGEMPNIDMDTFLAQEQFQWKPNPNAPENIQMNIAYVKQTATDTIENNTNDLDDFLARAKQNFIDDSF